MNKYQIRKITRADRKLLSNLILKAVSKSGAKSLLTIIQSDAVALSDNENPEDEIVKLGIKIVYSIYEALESEIEIWFASLLNISVEDLNSCDFNVDKIILEQLTALPEFKDFFFGLFQQFNLIKKYLPSSMVGRKE